MVKLTPVQLGMIFDSTTQQGAKYLSQAVITLHEEVDIEFLIQSIKIIFSQHLFLNGRIVFDCESYVFDLVEGVKFNIKYTELSNLTDLNEVVTRYLDRDKRNEFKLQDAPLIRVTIFFIKHDLYKLVFTYPHFILCASSAYKIIKDVFLHYDHHHRITSVNQLKNYQEFYQKYSELQSENYIDYWYRLLKNEEPCSLPIFEEPGLTIKDFPDIGHLFIRMGKEKASAFKNVSRRYKTSQNILFQALLGLTLRAFVNQQHVFIGVVRSFDPRLTKGITGLFINVLPIFITLTREKKLSEIIGQLYLQHKGFKKFGYVSIGAIENRLGILPEQSLFDCLVDYKEKTLIENLRQQDKHWKNRELDYFTETNHKLLVEIYGIDNEIEIRLSYDRRFISNDYANSIRNTYQTIINNALANKNNLSTAELLIFSASSLVGHKNQITASDDIIRGFQQVIKKYPYHDAFIYENKKLTFSELYQLTDTLSAYCEKTYQFSCLEKVIIFLDRSMEYVISIITCLKLRCIFIPIDPSWNESIIIHILNNCQAKYIITLSGYGYRFENFKKNTLILLDKLIIDLSGKKVSYEAKKVDGNDPVYILYTSGTTGNPKGAINKHISINNRIAWMARKFSVNNLDTILHKTPISFDVSLWEILLPLVTGASVVIVTKEKHYDISYISKLISDNQITMIHFVPSVLNMFLDVDEKIIQFMSCLRLIICSGEELSDTLARKCVSCLNARLYNLYGPTEAAIDVTSFLYKKSHELPMVPIGTAIDNVELFIRSNDLLPVPQYGIGELFIGEVAVGLGYINNDEETKKRFITLENNKSQRIYRTGDIVKLISNNQIVYKGRIDNQVKINGVRIELAEIDITLEKLNYIKKSITVVKDNQIISYVKTNKNIEDLLNKIDSFLIKNLNKNRIPNHIIVIDSFPLTHNGKIDLKALPEPKLSQSENSNLITDLEKKLILILSNLFDKKIDEIKVNDSLMGLGLNSLKAMKLVMILQYKFGVDINVVDILRSKTIKSLAKKIDTYEMHLPNENTHASLSVKRDSQMDSTCNLKLCTLTQDENNISTLDNFHCENLGLQDTTSSLTSCKGIPFSEAQYRLWVLSQLSIQEPVFNMAALIQVNGFSKDRIFNALNSLLKNNPIICSRVELDGDIPYLNINVPVENIINFEKFGDEITNISFITREFCFYKTRLDKDPLSAIKVISYSKSTYYILFRLHHIICDGWSINILVNQLITLLEVNNINQNYIQTSLPYIKYFLQEKSYLHSEKFNQDLQYWRNNLEGFESKIIEPDHEFDSGFSGERLYFNIENNQYQQISNFIRSYSITEFNFFLSIFMMLMNFYSGKQDITVSVPFADRQSYQVENCIGLFLNTILIRVILSDQMTFLELIIAVKSSYEAAMLHGKIPINKLINELKLNVKSDISQVLFNFSPIDLSLSNSFFSAREIYTETAKTPIKLEIYRREFSYHGYIEFQKKYFDTDTIKLLKEDFLLMVNNCPLEYNEKLFSISNSKEIV